MIKYIVTVLATVIYLHNKAHAWEVSCKSIEKTDRIVKICMPAKAEIFDPDYQVTEESFDFPVSRVDVGIINFDSDGQLEVSQWGTNVDGSVAHAESFEEYLEVLKKGGYVFPIVVEAGKLNIEGEEIDLFDGAAPPTASRVSGFIGLSGAKPRLRQSGPPGRSQFLIQDDAFIASQVKKILDSKKWDSLEEPLIYASWSELDPDSDEAAQ